MTSRESANATPDPLTVPAGLLDALRCQRQVDADGTECGVSRQAVDEAIAILERLPDVAELVDRLRLEAQVHAQEARTANATIAEIYQVCTGARGEPGNWNGAEPVRALVAQRDRLLAALRPFANIAEYRGLREAMTACLRPHEQECMPAAWAEARAAIAACEAAP